MIKVFVLEDDPQRIKKIKEMWSKYAEFDIATSYDEAIKIFKNDYNLLMLDHDLGGKIFVNSNFKNTGAGFARWLVTQDFKKCDIIIHSHNSSGATVMAKILLSKNIDNVLRLPFGNIVDGWNKGFFKFFGHYKGEDEQS
jgi:CheY-like chemotaxis protein